MTSVLEPVGVRIVAGRQCSAVWVGMVEVGLHIRVVVAEGAGRASTTFPWADRLPACWVLAVLEVLPGRSVGSAAAPLLLAVWEYLVGLADLAALVDLQVCLVDYVVWIGED